VNKTTLILVLVFLGGYLQGQSIEDTYNLIKSTEAELVSAYEAHDVSVQNIVKDYERPEVKSEFDTKREYQNKLLAKLFIPRIKQWAQIVQLEKDNVQPIRTRLDRLRFSTFYSDSITVTPIRYNAEKQLWTMQVKHLQYKKELLTIDFPIPRDQARSMNLNWPQVFARGVLGFDPNDEISLIQITLTDPESGMEFKHNLDNCRRFFNTDEVAKEHWFTFSKDQKYLYYEETINCIHKYLSVKNLNNGKKIGSRELDWGMENITLSPDGRVLAFVESENGEGIHFTFLPEANNIYQIKGEYYNQILISPDSRHLIYSTSSYPNRYTVMIRDLYSNVDAVLLETYKRITVLAFSPDCTKLLMGMEDVYPKDKLKVIDLATLQVVNSYDLEGIQKIKFSPDGNILALSYSSDGDHLLILNSKTYDKIDEIGQGLFHQFFFSSDSRYILKNSWGAMIYDLQTKKYVYDSTSSPEFIDSIFYPDERYVLEGAWISRTYLYIDPMEPSGLPPE